MKQVLYQRHPSIKDIKRIGKLHLLSETELCRYQGMYICIMVGYPIRWIPCGRNIMQIPYLAGLDL